MKLIKSLNCLTLSLLISANAFSANISSQKSSTEKHRKPAMSKPLPLPNDPNKLVFLFSGQSNMFSGAQLDHLKSEYSNYSQLPSNVTFYYGKLADNDPIVEKLPSFDGQKLNTSHHFGPEVSFAQEISKAFPDKKLIIIKYSAPGTSTMDWAPNWHYIEGKTQKDPIYHKLFKKLLARLNKTWELQGQSLPIDAFFWMQGESDAMLQIPNYAKHLKTIVDELKTQTGSPNFYFILGRIFNYEKTNNPYFKSWEELRDVRNDQVQFEWNYPKTKWIDTDDFNLFNDKTHFDEDSEIMLGQRMAQAFIQFKKLESTDDSSDKHPNKTK